MALILLIFFGQVMSVPFASCEKNMSHPQSTEVNNESVSAKHDMFKMKGDMSGMIGHAGMMSEDCCGPECNCLLSSCVSVMMDVNNKYSIFNTFKSVDMSPLRAFFVNHHSPLILRPPIFS